jgi:hypothetical protein
MICCMSTEFASTIFSAVFRPALIKREDKLLQNPILTSTSRELCVVGLATTSFSLDVLLTTQDRNNALTFINS